MLAPLWAALVLTVVQPAAEPPHPPLSVRVVNADGSPAPAGVRAGILIDFGMAIATGPGLMLFSDTQPPPATDSRGQVSLPHAAVFGDPANPRRQSLIVFEDARTLMGLAVADPGDSDSITVTLVPPRRIAVHFKSPELEHLNLPITSSVVYAHWNDLRPAVDSGTGAERSLLLPPGEYSLFASGARMQSRRVPLHVDAGQGDLPVEIDLPASRLAHLQNHPAPELAGIKAWDGQPVTLQSLRGQVVLLEFWGTWCGPCIESMPKLVALYDRFHERGLAVVAVHDDSVDSLDHYRAKVAPIRAEHWGRSDLPFPVAIDGGGLQPIPGQDRKARGITTACYGISGFPTAVLIDRDGNVVGEFDYRADDASDRMNRILVP